MTVVTMTKSKDADAAYILNEIAEAERLDKEAKEFYDKGVDKAMEADARRLNAGKRLIEVRDKRSRKSNLPDKSLSGTFEIWLRDNNIHERTAYRLMQQAGWTEEQRINHKAKVAADKREDRAKEKSTIAANEPKVITEPDVVTIEEIQFVLNYLGQTATPDSIKALSIFKRLIGDL